MNKNVSHINKRKRKGSLTDGFSEKVMFVGAGAVVWALTESGIVCCVGCCSCCCIWCCRSMEFWVELCIGCCVELFCIIVWELVLFGMSFCIWGCAMFSCVVVWMAVVAAFGAAFSVGS